MTEQKMWNAVKNSDARYDGLFFYAVKTTGIFCRPSCRSKLPKRENICYFSTAKEAYDAGFRPCKRCRSDLVKYQPMQDVAKEIRDKLDQSAALDEVGLCRRRFVEIFKQEYGMTPKEYVAVQRLETAKEMLTHTEQKVIDVAEQAGFSSLSTFNRYFKRKTGKTPTEYRKGCSTQKDFLYRMEDLQR